MYNNYNIPQNNNNYQKNYKNYLTTTYYNNGDRFIGSGFLAPFLLGGVGGYLIGKPNNFNNQGPIPVYFPPNQQIPYYPYSNTNIYY